MAKKIPIRKIIHIDMDAFYASVEQLDNPNLKGKPLAVGGGEHRGVVSAASYEARRFGVRSAMTGAMAKRNCPELIFVKPRFKRYKEISNMIQAIFHDYTDLVEPLSLDEAYLDVTENKKGNPSATLMAQDIRARILEEVGLTASAGISINKFIAKIASDYNKPNGQKTVPPEEIIPFLEGLDIRKFYGVGKVTARHMYELGIFNGKDLKQKPLEFLDEHFGKSGLYYFNAVRGIHNSPVEPNRIRKSLAAERTFDSNLSSEVFMLDKLDRIADEVARRLNNSKVKGKTITLKIKYSDFTLQTRSKTLGEYIDDKGTIMQIIRDLLFQEKPKDSVRLLGISISNLNTQEHEPGEPQETNISVQLKFAF
ncbi:MAG: DNA polymerase IV [Bacteroidia bacterium]|nr:DNA polymerase IV [Bacteroidia bacterium]MBT8269242.1 DNA polymerase IV [Bacteroidia bacterium]NNF83195.1 DNA polymerase IV [Flavobacteriaceae bacterium]NNK70814.1 DNA polymerase IV [Flavobacteriaceae bacterium]NNL78990.1 DNA polymerase IV [Flavobacteriaceae bacterium]